MSRTVSFTVNDEEYRLIEFEAKARGLTPSQLAKTSLFSHMNKYAVKGVMAENHRAVQELRESLLGPTFAGSHGNLEEGEA